MWLPWKRSSRTAEESGGPEFSNNSAEARVQHFQRDFKEQWKASGPMIAKAKERDESIFPIWKEFMAPVEQRHFLASARPGLGSHWSGQQIYGDGAETYVRSERMGDDVRVLYRKLSTIGGKFHEYVVREQEGDFRIAEVLVHYSDPVLPYLNEEQIRERQRECAADAPLEELFDYDLLLDHDQNFTNRVVQYRDGTISQTVVEQIGTLTTATGVLSVWDYGWDNDGARPLARTVPPGSYPVDRVTAFDRNASVRVRFSDERTVEWRPAQCGAGERDTVGVDAGCICIVDYPAYASMTPREKATVYDAFNEVPRPSAQQFGMPATTGIACDSGFGDGSYPVYWGLDADERITQLVVDFSVLLTKDEDGKYRHL